MSFFRRISSIRIKEEQKEEVEKENFDENEILPSRIVNPPIKPFRKKTQSYATFNLTPKRKTYSIHLLNKLEKQEEIAKVACELCKINPIDRSNDEILGLVKVTSFLNYFDQINRKKWHKNERVHERCCALMGYEFLEKGRVVFTFGEKPKKFYIIFKGSVVVLIPKTAEKFLLDKDEQLRENSKNSFDFSYLLYLKSKNRLKNFEKNYCDSPEMQVENEDESKISRKDKLQNTLKKFSDLLGGLSFFDIHDVEKLFQDGVLKYTFYKEIKAGEHFGDLGIIRDKPRSATIICKDDCSFGILLAEEFKNIFAVVERKKFDEKIEFFKEFFLKKVNENDLVKFVYAFEKRKLRRNEILYREGDKINAVYLIKKGEVQFYKLISSITNTKKKDSYEIYYKFGRKLPIIENNIREKKTLLNLLRGEFFGDEELFEIKGDISKYAGLTRNFSVTVTSSKASIYVCPIEFFVKFIQERPALKNKIYKSFLSRKEIRDKCLKFASYAECETLIKNAHSSNSLHDINFRKSVDDLNHKLDSNPNKRNFIINENSSTLPSKKIKNSCPHSYFSTKSNITQIGGHDKVVRKIKLNNERIKKPDIEITNEIFCDQKIISKKLLKNLNELQNKYADKNNEGKFSKTYYYSRTLKTINNKDKQTDRDNIDQILITSKSNFKFELNSINDNSKTLKSFTLEPNLWTARTANF